MQSSDMNRGRAATWLAGVFVAAFTLTLGGILYAGNQWSRWHWPGPQVGIIVAEGSGTDEGDYDVGNGWEGVLNHEINDWYAGTCMTSNGGSEVTVSLMALNEQLRYAAGNGYQAVELPYAGRELAMLVLVPDEGRPPRHRRRKTAAAARNAPSVGAECCPSGRGST